MSDMVWGIIGQVHDNDLKQAEERHKAEAAARKALNAAQEAQGLMNASQLLASLTADVSKVAASTPGSEPEEKKDDQSIDPTARFPPPPKFGGR